MSPKELKELYKKELCSNEEYDKTKKGFNKLHKQYLELRSKVNLERTHLAGIRQKINKAFWSDKLPVVNDLIEIRKSDGEVIIGIVTRTYIMSDNERINSTSPVVIICNKINQYGNVAKNERGFDIWFSINVFKDEFRILH